ncbi:MAG: type IV secretory system conjugative DNA transfer family protein [Defluviitaleaceae bacterium]|nr:type IV secretory system conjugative DNA transfer family protein [Defluviitaleaceae bacterium]
MVDMFYLTTLLERGIRQYLRWDYQLFPNLLVLGNTGSGKSYALRILLARIVHQIPDSRLWVCDFKNELLPQSAPRYWGYKAVMDGFNAFCEVFDDRLQGNPDRTFCLLLMDEYVSWLSSMEKRETEEVKKRMAQLLFMVRSMNMHVCLGTQRGLAENFTYGSRDCLSVLFLGAPSKESVRSFATGEEAEAIKPRGRGEGFALFDGRPPKAITVPTIRDMERVQELIIHGASR